MVTNNNYAKGEGTTAGAAAVVAVAELQWQQLWQLATPTTKPNVNAIVHCWQIQVSGKLHCKEIVRKYFKMIKT